MLGFSLSFTFTLGGCIYNDFVQEVYALEDDIDVYVQQSYLDMKNARYRYQVTCKEIIEENRNNRNATVDTFKDFETFNGKKPFEKLINGVNALSEGKPQANFCIGVEYTNVERNSASDVVDLDYYHIDSTNGVDSDSD